MIKKKKKVNEENKKQKTISEPTETIGTEQVKVETTETKSVVEIKKIDKLSVGFPNDDMNQVVAKLNELIDKFND